jgi:hypothetical protein
MAKRVEPSEAVTAILDHFDEVTDRSFKPLADALYAQFDSDTLTADASLIVALWATTELERVTNAVELVKLWHEVEFGERHPAGGLELGEDSPRYAKVRAFIESRFLAKVLPILESDFNTFCLKVSSLSSPKLRREAFRDASFEFGYEFDVDFQSTTALEDAIESKRLLLKQLADHEKESR